ncbi:MAG: 50S ribosomal protein L25 [Armatimonadia bacterium]
MEQFAIAAQRRDKIGTGSARAYRREGLIPGVVYGHGGEPLPVLIAAKDMQSFLRHHGNVAQLNIAGEAEEAGMGVLLKDTQRHPISREVLSVDFLRISLTEKVQLNVPLVLVGEAVGVKMEDGVLEQSVHELSVECLPTSIPQQIELDIAGLHVGHSLHVRDIVVPEGVVILTGTDEDVASISRRAKAETLEAEAEEGAAVAVEEAAEGKE